MADFDTFILVKNNETIATACQIYVVGINCDTVGTTLHLTCMSSRAREGRALVVGLIYRTIRRNLSYTIITLADVDVTVCIYCNNSLGSLRINFVPLAGWIHVADSPSLGSSEEAIRSSFWLATNSDASPFHS